MTGSGNVTNAVPAATDLFVRATVPLRPTNAVAALLTLEDGRYLVQLRDALAQIFYPEHWGCFGGGVDVGEDPLTALRRELREELELELDEAREFTRFDFDFSALGHPNVYRIYYEARVSNAAAARLVLHEGQEMRAFAVDELLLGGCRITPYDAFALWMHAKRHIFMQTGS